MAALEYKIIGAFLIVWLVVYPLLIFLPWYIWWNKHDHGKKHNCFNLALLAYYKYNYPLYKLLNFVSSGQSQMKGDYWVIFLNGIMTSEAVGVIEQGLCTPKTLCESLIPTDAPRGSLPAPFLRKWPSSSSGWKQLLMSWMGMTKVPGSQSEWRPNMTTWNNPLNFLANWGITPNSPIIIGFVTGESTWGNDEVYPTALNPLLGIRGGGPSGTDYGGWFGFLQDGHPFGERGLNEVNRAIWSNEPVPQGQKIKKHVSKCDKSSVAASAIGTGIAMGAMGGLAAAPETVGISIPVGIVIGLLGGILTGGLTGAVGGHCL